MDNDILKYIVSNGMIDLDAVQEKMKEDELKQQLTRHPYKIFQDKDGRWKTTLPDKDSKSGRKLIAKKNRDDLYEVLRNFYKELDINPYSLSPDITLENLYPTWIKSRLLEVNSVNTVKRNMQDWNRYYKDTEIVKIPMKHLGINQLKDWAHTLIKNNNLDKRGYYNATVIIKKCFEFAKDGGVCSNTWQEVNINKAILRKTRKKNNVTEIYFYEEKAKLIAYCLRLFSERPWGISTLAIPLLFLTGMRIGEIVALKYDDIKDTKIVINRSEVNDYEYEEKKQKMKYNGKRIVDHAKTDAGIREIPLTKGAKQIISLVKEASIQYKYHDNGYIFCPNSRRITSNSIDIKLYRYCEKIGIPAKSAHKIRKTYISQIIRDGIDMDTVCKVSGHVDLKTTFESYLFCLDHEEEIESKFNEILLLPQLDEVE